MRWMGTFGLLALAACGDGGGDSASDLVGDPVAGEKVYQATCARSDCHGPDGSGAGSDAADLANEVPAKSDAEIRSILDNGEDLMAPLDLSNQEVADVIAYLRQEFPG
jgi:mono/diheme cytochrome c family protein